MIHPEACSTETDWNANHSMHDERLRREEAALWEAILRPDLDMDWPFRDTLVTS